MRHVGKFRILRKLGAGGMGVVYEAEDLELGVRVALKTLHTTNPQTLYRFKQEFRALAEIVHPRLVRLFELVSEAGVWFFTMEFVEDGVNLLEWLDPDRAEHRPRQRTAAEVSHTLAGAKTAQSEPLPESGTFAGATTEVLSGSTWLDEATPASPVASARRSDPNIRSYERLRAAFAELAEGAQVLHAAGRLHRDLKPENVFVRTGSGHVVLLDFGLVAALEQRGPDEKTPPRRPEPAASNERANAAAPPVTESYAYHATQEGTVAGTFAYMAPEQALAQPLTAAADWYAVGVMLYEALTGELPYTGSSQEILLQKQRGIPPTPPILRVPATPADLSELCLELLRREPSARPLGSDIVRRLGGALGDGEASSAVRSVFVGRERQLAVLLNAFEGARAGATVAHVYGNSGAGKSALLGRLLGELERRDGTLVIAGRCYEQEFIPFKAVDSLMDALTHYLLKLPPEERNELLPLEQRVLSRVFPVLGRLAPAAPAGAEVDWLGARARAFGAMRELLVRLAERVRLVLFIDDLQWGDVDSAALLAEVLRPPDAPKLLLVLAYRSEQRTTNAALRATREACRRACEGRELELDVGALEPTDAEELAGALLANDEQKSALPWIVNQARGSAFLIHELVRHVKRGGALTGATGRTLDDILWERLRELSEESQKLVSFVAIAGRPVRLRHVQRAAELPALALPVVSALCQERLLRTQGTGAATELETVHDRVRESILQRLPAFELKAYAGALARVLEAASEGDAETLAALFERAGEPGHASGYYAEAVPKAVAALAFEHAEGLAKRAVELAQTDAERAVAYEAAIHFYTDMARFPEAYALTRAGAAALGLDLPEKFVPPLLMADFAAAKLKLWGKPAAHVLELPTMAPGRLELAVRLANAGAKAAYQVRPELCVAVCTKVVKLCLTHGNTAECAIGYMVFGAIFQGGILGRYRTGYDLGQVALALLDKYENERQRAEVSFVVGYFGMSWLRPAQEAEALWEKALSAGRATGDLFHLGCAAAGRMMSFAMRGVELDRIEREGEELAEELARHGLREPLAVVRAVQRAARALRQGTNSPAETAESDEAQAASAWQNFGARHFAHYCYLARAENHYLWGRLDAAVAACASAKKLAADSKGMLHSAEQLYCEALVLAAHAGRGTFSERRSLGRLGAKLAGWAQRCPANFAHKAELVRAERLRLAGDAAQAFSAYARAAELAREFGYANVEGLSHLLAARLPAERGEHADAEAALARATTIFRRWGATALASAPELLQRRREVVTAEASAGGSSSCVRSC
jgi:serine/threonine protein kinase/predicted ATPase